ncbi:hypothetical protein D3C85_638440 [compost metagenome]
MANARRFGIHLDIDGALRNLQYDAINRPTGPSVYNDKDGTLSNSAAYANLTIEKAKGRRCLPMSDKCGRPCPSGCAGFDYQAGCPGIEIAPDELDHRG